MGRNSTQWEALKGQRLRVQCTSGILIHGLLVGLEGTLLRLTDVKIGSREFYYAEPPWIYVDTEAVVACFPEEGTYVPD